MQREREARMQEVNELKLISSASRLRGTARSQRELIRVREYEIMHLWDAEIQLQWLKHDLAAQERQKELQQALSDLAIELAVQKTTGPSLEV